MYNLEFRGEIEKIMEKALPFILKKIYNLSMLGGETLEPFPIIRKFTDIPSPNINNGRANLAVFPLEGFHHMILKNGTKKIVHCLWAIKDDPSLIFEFMETFASLKRMYSEPILQILIYSGSNPPKKLINEFSNEICFFRFPIFNLGTINPREFLEMHIPELILMAVLGDFRLKDFSEIEFSIVFKLRELNINPEEYKKYIENLEILKGIKQVLLKKQKKHDGA